MAAATANPGPRVILGDPDEWEGAVPANVTAVLESAGAALLAHVPAAGRPTVQVGS